MMGADCGMLPFYLVVGNTDRDKVVQIIGTNLSKGRRAYNNNYNGRLYSTNYSKWKGFCDVPILSIFHYSFNDLIHYYSDVGYSDSSLKVYILVISKDGDNITPGTGSSILDYVMVSMDSHGVVLSVNDEICYGFWDEVKNKRTIIEILSNIVENVSREFVISTRHISSVRYYTICGSTISEITANNAYELVRSSRHYLFSDLLLPYNRDSM